MKGENTDETDDKMNQINELYSMITTDKLDSEYIEGFGDIEGTNIIKMLERRIEYSKAIQNYSKQLEKDFYSLRIYGDNRDFKLVKEHNHEHQPKIYRIYRRNPNKYKYHKRSQNESNLISKCELCLKEYIKAFKKFRKELFDSSKNIEDYIKRYKKKVGEDISKQQDKKGLVLPSKKKDILREDPLYRI